MAPFMWSLIQAGSDFSSGDRLSAPKRSDDSAREICLESGEESALGMLEKIEFVCYVIDAWCERGESNPYGSYPTGS
jgi:hypothetical protein